MWQSHDLFGILYLLHYFYTCRMVIFYTNKNPSHQGSKKFLILTWKYFIKQSNNFSFTTINKNLYIFGIARSEDERKIVINEAKAVQGIKEVIPSIFLKEDLANNQRIAN